jgi:hypothetical protein
VLYQLSYASVVSRTLLQPTKKVPRFVGFCPPSDSAPHVLDVRHLGKPAKYATEKLGDFTIGEIRARRHL